MPPTQLSTRLLPCIIALVTIGGALNTVKFMVAVLDNPLGSVARTAKLLSPPLPERGVPLRRPLLATLNQAGPLLLEKVTGSPLGSPAVAARVAEYAWPAVTLATVNGFAKNAGGRFVTA